MKYILSLFTKLKELNNRRVEKELERQKTLELFSKIFDAIETDRDNVIKDLENQIRNELNKEEGYNYIGVPSEVPPPCPEKFDND